MDDSRGPGVPRFQRCKGVPLGFQTWGRMAGPNPGFGGMTVRRGLGGAPSPGFPGMAARSGSEGAPKPGFKANETEELVLGRLRALGVSGQK